MTKTKEPLIYGCYWHEIQEQDRPENGELFMCLDSCKNIGEDTWMVAQMGDGTLSGDLVRLGLFWERKFGELFLQAILEKEETDHD